MADWNLRPARDHGLSPAERLRSPGREPGLGSLIVAGCWRGLVRTYLHTAHGFQVHGRDHLPQPPFVMVANHSSHLDALTLASALPDGLARRAYAVAAADTFFDSMPAAVFAAYAVNALPVTRGRPGAHSLDSLRARLHEDRAVLILFPEGTRSRTGAMGRFRPGIGLLVAGTEVPVVPCFLGGAYAAWPAGRRLPRPGPLSLHVGAPLRFGDAAPDRAGLASIAQACERAVRSLDPSQGPGQAPVPPTAVPSPNQPAETGFRERR